MQVVMALAATMLAAVSGAQSNDTAGAAAALRARHDTLRPQLIDNAFQRPLYLSSSKSGDHVEGDAYAELDQPFAAFAPAFKSAVRVCDVPFLHLNMRSCQGSPARGRCAGAHRRPQAQCRTGHGLSHGVLAAHRGRRARPPARLAGRQLGPVRDPGLPRVVIEAIALDGKRSFVHCRYARAYGRGPAPSVR